MRIRKETDSFGEVELPQDVYYGISTYRDHDNVQIFKKSISRQMIKGLAVVKKAAVKANLDAGLIEADKAKVIMLSCDEIFNGRLHGQFIVDLIQGGSGAGCSASILNSYLFKILFKPKGISLGLFFFVNKLYL